MYKLYFTINMSVCVSLFANYRSQYLLNRLGRYIKLLISTDIPSSQEFAYQFGLVFFLHAKNPKPSPLRQCSVDRHRLYFKHITYIDDFPSTGTRLVFINIAAWCLTVKLCCAVVRDGVSLRNSLLRLP